MTDRISFSVQTERTKEKEHAVEDAIEKMYGLTDRISFSVQTERTKEKEHAVEDAIEKMYGFGLSAFAKQSTRHKYKILLLSKIKIV